MSSSSQRRAALSPPPAAPGRDRSATRRSTRSTSAVAVCCSSASLRSRVALLQLGEQPRVLDGDHGLVRERLQQRDLLLGERASLAPTQMIAPMPRPSRSIGDRERGAQPFPTVELGAVRVGLRFSLYIRDVTGSPLCKRAPHDARQDRRMRLARTRAHRVGTDGDQPDHVAVNAVHSGVIGCTEADGRSAIVSSTSCTLLGDAAITRRTSERAVC